MPSAVRLDHLAIVLVRPRFPENIGAAARAMRNMGIKSLLVVDPENLDMERVSRMATHAAGDVIDRMQVFGTLPQALSPFQFVVGTTARLGRQRSVIASPERLAQKLIPVSAENQIAILFGSEDRGLTNTDIRLCHWLVNIPTADFSSLNLAQAVMVTCYALFNAVPPARQSFTPKLANRHELDGMYEQVKDILVRIDYIKPQNPDYWMNRLRHFFTRLKLQAKEVSMIRGICRQINWYSRKCYGDGIAGNPPPTAFVTSAKKPPQPQSQQDSTES